LLPLIGGEVFIRLVVAPSAQEKTQFENKLNQIQNESFNDYQGPQMGRLIPHPYWGHQLNTSFEGANNFGFPESENLPYKRKTHEFVVGLFGASVARWAADKIKSDLENQEGLRCGRRLKLLNFANDGYLQPSQLHIASYFIENLDATINLDGHNEVAASNRYATPINYPYFFHEQYLTTPAKAKLLTKSFAMEKRKQLLAKTLLGLPLLLKSDFIYYLGYRAEAWFEIKKWEYLDKMKGLSPHVTTPVPRSELMQDGPPSWEKYTLMQYKMEKAFQIPAYFFIQPSQYSPDGKVFSDEETRVALHSNPDRVEDFKKVFLKLRQSGKKMQTLGVDVIDLMSLFSKNNESIFIDTCCHINQRGNEILGSAIAKEVINRINRLPCKR
jgi:hypothetical protein